MNAVVAVTKPSFSEYEFADSCCMRSFNMTGVMPSAAQSFWDCAKFRETADSASWHMPPNQAPAAQGEVGGYSQMKSTVFVQDPSEKAKSFASVTVAQSSAVSPSPEFHTTATREKLPLAHCQALKVFSPT